MLQNHQNYTSYKITVIILHL